MSEATLDNGRTHKRLRTSQTVLTVLGLSAVVLIFLPFVGSAVPAEVFMRLLPVALPPFGLGEGLLFWWLAPCVLLPFAISAGYLRVLLSKRRARGERGAGYAAALMSAGPLLVFQLWDWSFDWSDDIWVSVVYLLISFAAGTGLVLQNRRTGVPAGLNGLVAMQVVYIALALWWITGFVLVDFIDAFRAKNADYAPNGGAGAYLAVVTVVVYGAQIFRTPRTRHPLAFLIPLGLLWMGLLLWMFVEAGLAPVRPGR